MHLLLRGVVDFSKEVARLEKERKLKQGLLERLQAKRADPNYASRVPESTQTEDKEKEEGLAGEVKLLESTIAQFAAEQDA